MTYILNKCINDDTFHALREAFKPKDAALICRQDCHGNEHCIENAKKGNCALLNNSSLSKNIDDMVLFSTGTGPYGFQYAIQKNALENTKPAIEKFLVKPFPCRNISSADKYIEKALTDAELENNLFAKFLWWVLCIEMKAGHLEHKYVVYAYSIARCEVLGDGWYWIHYNDISGGLCRADDGSKFYVSYSIFPSYIEYVVHEESRSFFYESLSEFYKFAEELIRKRQDLSRLGIQRIKKTEDVLQILKTKN